MSFLNKYGVRILVFKLFLHANGSSSPMDLASADDHPCNSSTFGEQAGLWQIMSPGRLGLSHLAFLAT